MVLKKAKIAEMDSKEKILVVDDAPEALEVLQRNLSSEGYTVYTASFVADAIKILDSTPIDLVITDLKMPKVGGLELVRHVRENFRDTEVMMITGFATIEGAVKAVKSGAEEYLTKPFTDEELFSAVKRSLDKLYLRRSAEIKIPQLPAASHGLLGESEPMKKVFAAISKAASVNATVMILGESGTGKELVARAIHYNSPRASAPFIPVNCDGIPEGLFESELFGYIKGAFTGANESRAGFFQTAEGGAIFLDEISETSVAMQVKLLRALQDKEVCMLGATRTRKIDVRILVATNKDLIGMIKKGVFREDLFFRLNVITIVVPPLRERGDDILLLARHFIAKYAGEMDRPTPKLSDKALQIFKNYSWPGNVRELENLVQRLVVMTDHEIIDTPDFPAHMRFSAMREAGFNRTLIEVEAEYVRNVLASVNNNKTKAAEILGIDRKTLREKFKNIGDSTD